MSRRLYLVDFVPEYDDGAEFRGAELMGAEYELVGNETDSGGDSDDSIVEVEVDVDGVQGIE